jgi:hypothetical protein
VVDTPVEIRRLWSLIDRFLAHGDAGPLSPEELAAVLCEDPVAGGPVIAEYRAWQPATAATLRADDPAGRARHFRQPLRSVQVGDLKYVRGIDGSEELYDVRRDPGELHDLAAERPEVLGRLRELMDRCFASLGTAAPAEDRPLSSELTEELKALGYLR